MSDKQKTKEKVKSAEEILRQIFPPPKNEAEKNDDANIIIAMKNYANQFLTPGTDTCKCNTNRIVVRHGGLDYCNVCTKILSTTHSDKEIDEEIIYLIRGLIHEMEDDFWRTENADDFEFYHKIKDKLIKIDRYER